MPQNAALGIHHSESDGDYNRKSTAIGREAPRFDAGSGQNAQHTGFLITHAHFVKMSGMGVIY